MKTQEERDDDRYEAERDEAAVLEYDRREEERDEEE